jgi:SAM-dependent methyltransferase
MLLEFIARMRRQLAADLEGSELRWRFSPILLDLRRRLVPRLRASVSGRLLDVGCGTLPFKPYIERYVESYDGLDVERRSEQTRFISDARNMVEIADDSYDSVISLSMLEHIPDPWLALREMRRVCRPGGSVIILIPHLMRLHEEPHDYYRFTPYGLRALAEQAGFRIVAIESVSGLSAFIAHQISTLVVCTLWRVPLLKWVAFWMNYLLIVLPANALDRILRTADKYPANVVGILRVPDQAES